MILATVLLLGGATAGFLLRSGRAKAPNVIVILLDTLRADHLGIYGHERDTTHNLDAFGRANVTFMHAYTAAPWTPPSVASIFTGLYVTSHGMMPPNGRDTARSALVRLSDDLVTMSERLKARGYATIAISPNPWIVREFGYAQGFDTFTYTDRARANVMTREAIRELEALQVSAPDTPFFLYLHYLDPHDPYDPPAPYRDRYQGPLQHAGHTQYGNAAERNINLYDGEIAFMDDELQKLFVFLQAQSDYDNSVIVIVGDHGEQFGEHGHTGHGFDLYNEETHVPLIVKPPGKPQARTVPQVVSTVDILPTTLTLCGAEVPGDLPGVSLFDQQALDARRGVMSEIRRISVQWAYVDAQGRKLIVGSGDGTVSGATADDQTGSIIGVYDSIGEGVEQTSIQDPALLRALQSELTDSIQAARANRPAKHRAPAQVDDSTIEQLRSLGYLK